MRLSDLTDFLALRRHLESPRELLRLRKRPAGDSLQPVRLRGGGSIHLRPGTLDRHILLRIFGRDEYHLGGIPPGSCRTVVDIGAHIGLFSIRAAAISRRVISCEPWPDNFDLLIRNTSSFPNIAPRRQALWSRRGTATLHLSGNPAAPSLLPGLADCRERIPVECLTLEDLFREHAIDRCDILKLDCEGAEYEILFGAPRELLRRIDRICMEYHRAPGGPETWTGEGLLSFLASAGHEARLVPRRKKPGSGHLFSRRKDP
jgi:FkbM family methyltransferase